MAIQFNCISCLKAIEVADEWANRLVECPYCGDTVTAPGMSQLRTPVAAPIDTTTEAEVAAPGVPAGQPVMHYPPSGLEPIQRRSSFDGLALTGLVLGIGAILLFFWIAVCVATEIGNRLSTGAAPEEIKEFIDSATANQAPWLVKLSIYGLGMLLLWFSASLISGIALWRNRRERRGQMAYWAFGVNMVLPFLVLLSLACGA